MNPVKEEILQKNFIFREIPSQEEEKAVQDKIENIRQEIRRLESIGMGNTENASRLWDILADLTKSQSSVQSRQNLIDFVRELKESFPGAIMITWDDFFEICEKYNLQCGPLSVYTGLIPEENIQEIQQASEISVIRQIKNFYAYHLQTVEITSDTTRKERKELIKKLSIFPFVNSSGSPYNLPSKYHQIKSSYVGTDWLIAAPASQMTDNIIIRVLSKAEEQRRILAEDPIVFKATEWGPMIVSMWDKEATDEIFEKYK